MRPWALVVLALLLVVGLGAGVLVSRELNDVDQKLERRIVRVETIIQGTPGPQGPPGETRIVVRNGRLVAINGEPVVGPSGPAGPRGPGPTDAQVFSVLRALCGSCAGPRGPAGPAGPRGPAGPTTTVTLTVTERVTHTVVVERTTPGDPGQTVTTPGQTITVPPPKPPPPKKPCPPKNPRCP